MQRNRLAFIAVASLFAGALPFFVNAQQADSAAVMCISSNARQTISACPTGAPPPDRRAGRPTPPSHLVETKRPQSEKQGGPSGPGFELSQDQRRGAEARQVRARDLLEQEAQVLQRLVDRTRAGDARGADSLLRLAETYFELQNSWNTQGRQLDQPIYEAREDATRTRTLQQQQQQALTRAGEYREQALNTYVRLVQNFPNYPRMDEVLFSIAFSYQEMQQFERARDFYRTLIKNHPGSRFLPNAYLSFGEYYFQDGDMRAAQQFYTKVTDFPPPQNTVYGYALYKMSWALYNVDDFQGALNQFARVIEYANQNPQDRNAPNLARQARRELVMPYARVGRPDRALEFFRRYATNDEQANEMLESLAELYFDTGQWNDSISIYRRMIADQPNGDKLCYWQSRITSAIVSSRPKPEQVVEARRLTDLAQVFNRGSHPAESVTQCKQATAQVLLELATAWHREAIGTESQPGTNDRNTMGLAAQLYRELVEKFPDLDSLEFPDIRREDWPTQYRIRYFQSELLWKMEDWAACGPSFDSVVELNPQGEYTADAAYGSVLCYNNLYQQQYSATERQVRSSGDSSRRGRGARGRQAEPEEPSLAMRDFTPTEVGMLASFQRYVCFVRDSDELANIRYRRARVYYVANHFEEAALLFREVVTNHPTDPIAQFAGNLYFDSLNSIYTRDNRNSCREEMSNALDPMATTLRCQAGAASDDPNDVCATINRLRYELKRKECEEIAGRSEHREAATCYVALFRLNQTAERVEEVLWNAALHYEAARLIGQAIRVRTLLVERFGTTELGKRALYLIGANFHALAYYDRAAQYYEQFATRFPGEDGRSCSEADRTANLCAIAHQGLENAIVFRIGLGQDDQALEDARLYERNFRTRKPRETATVVYSLGAIYERRGEWQRAFDHYRNFLRNYGRSALPHEIIRANVQMGRSVWEIQQDRRERAEPFFRTAVTEFERAQQRIERLEATDAEKQLWWARSRDAASEAIFYLAEYRFQAFRAINFPRFSGTRNAAAVTRWANDDFRPWITRKFESLNVAREAYARVNPLEIPQWRIAAAERVGEMYRSIIDDVRSAPIPQEIENDDELYGIYVDALEGVLTGGPNCAADSPEPNCVGSPMRQAMGAFESCLTLATQVRWFNNYSQQCEVELNRLDAARYPLAAELRGTASFVQDQVGDPRPAELTREAEVGEANAPANAAATNAATGGAQ